MWTTPDEAPDVRPPWLPKVSADRQTPPDTRPCASPMRRGRRAPGGDPSPGMPPRGHRARDRRPQADYPRWRKRDRPAGSDESGRTPRKILPRSPGRPSKRPPLFPHPLLASETQKCDKNLLKRNRVPAPHHVMSYVLVRDAAAAPDPRERLRPGGGRVLLLSFVRTPVQFIGGSVSTTAWLLLIVVLLIVFGGFGFSRRRR